MPKRLWVKHQGRRVYIPRAPEDACGSKIRYDTEIAARMGAQCAMSTHRGGARRLWVYPCRGCAGWHLSSTLNERPAVTPRELSETTSRQQLQAQGMPT